jgi:hypothetical protein
MERDDVGHLLSETSSAHTIEEIYGERRIVGEIDASRSFASQALVSRRARCRGETQCQAARAEPRLKAGEWAATRLWRAGSIGVPFVAASELLLSCSFAGTAGAARRSLMPLMEDCRST